jgi:hypothetical protein
LNDVIKEFEELATKSDERLMTRRDKKKKWGELEVVINSQFVSILAALPAKLLANVFNNLIGQKGAISPCEVVRLKMEKEKDGEDTDFVEPDLLLKGDDSLCMVEIKTRGGKTSSRSYPRNQLLNYMRLVDECRSSQDKLLPSKFSHLILVPNQDMAWLEKHEKWVKEIQGHRFHVQPEKCVEVGNAYVKEHSTRIKQILVDTPIYYCSWQNVAESFDKAVLELNDVPNQAHWKRVGDELRTLAARASKYV